jgi:hypothetical protein
MQPGQSAGFCFLYDFLYFSQKFTLERKNEVIQAITVKEIGAGRIFLRLHVADLLKFLETVEPNSNGTIVAIAKRRRTEWTENFNGHTHYKPILKAGRERVCENDD